MDILLKSSTVASTPRLITLTNRTGQSVNLKVSRRQHDDKQYLFLQPSEEGASNLTSKNANYFAVQLAQGLQVSPKSMNIIELRRGKDVTEVWRWRLKLADDFIVDTIPEQIPKSAYQDFLLQLAS